MPTSQGSGHPSAGYVVKVTPADNPHHPRWIGERNPAGMRWLGNRSDARIFATPDEAKQEIQAFHRMLTGAFSYEIESV